MVGQWVKKQFEILYHKGKVLAGNCSSPTLEDMQKLLENAEGLTKRAKTVSEFSNAVGVLGEAGDTMGEVVNKINELGEKAKTMVGDVRAACEISKAISMTGRRAMARSAIRKPPSNSIGSSVDWQTTLISYLRRSVPSGASFLRASRTITSFRICRRRWTLRPSVPRVGNSSNSTSRDTNKSKPCSCLNRRDAGMPANAEPTLTVCALPRLCPRTVLVPLR